MVFETERRKVEEHEPIHPHPRVEMSPHPTRSDRVHAEGGIRRKDKPPKPTDNKYVTVGGATGRTQPDRRLRIDLRHARARTAIGGLIDALEFALRETGKLRTADGRRELRAARGGGAPVVVRGGESPSHGEGVQLDGFT